MVEAVLVAIETFFEWVPGETSVCLNSLVSFCDCGPIDNLVCLAVFSHFIVSTFHTLSFVIG